MESLRVAKVGNQRPWSIEELRIGFTKFYDEYGYYPTAQEIDTFPYLPSTRSIERRFGGLVAARRQLNLPLDPDLRAGEHSSRRAYIINDRAHKVEQKVYDFLCGRFGKEFVHREFFFSDDRRTRADFFIYDNNKGFCVDVFYPASLKNLSGCLNNKQSTYNSKYMRQYPVIFLQMNDAIDQSMLDTVLQKKKNQLQKDQHLMCWDSFTKYCQTRNPLRLLRRG